MQKSCKVSDGLCIFTHLLILRYIFRQFILVNIIMGDFNINTGHDSTFQTTMTQMECLVCDTLSHRVHYHNPKALDK